MADAWSTLQDTAKERTQLLEDSLEVQQVGSCVAFVNTTSYKM